MSKKLFIGIGVAVAIGAAAVIGLSFSSGEDKYEAWGNLLAPGGSAETAAEICTDSKTYCEDFKMDPQCTAQRNEAIVRRKIFTSTDGAEEQFRYMLALESFIQCSEKWSGIEYRSPAQRFALEDKRRGRPPTAEEQAQRDVEMARYYQKQNFRDDNVKRSKELLGFLNEHSKTVENPYLWYWRWSRLGDMPASTLLIEEDIAGRINDAELLYYVSEIYIKYNDGRARSAMMRALKALPAEHYIAIKEGNEEARGLNHIHIFRELVRLAFKENDLKKAYLYSRLLKLNNDNTIEFDQIAKAAKQSGVDIKEMDLMAKTIHRRLQKGTLGNA